MADHASLPVDDRATAEDHQAFRTNLALHAALQSTLQVLQNLRFDTGPVIDSDPEDAQMNIGRSVGPPISPGRLDHLRSNNRMSTLGVRQHEICAVTTDTTDEFWEEMRRRGHVTTIPPTIRFYFAANPRMRCPPEEILAFEGPEEYKIIKDPECELDLISPFSWLQRNWWVMPIPVKSS